MRIGLDARTVFAPQRRGIGKSLLRLYRELALVRPDWDVVLYHRETAEVPELLASRFARARAIEMPGDRFDAWERLRLPAAAWRDGCDALHCPANTGPGWTPLPTIVTVHDLIPLELPESVSPEEARRFERGVVAACRRAAAVFCPSAYTRDRLVEGLLVEPERVFVTPWGADEFTPIHEARLVETMHRYRVDRPFVLHFGAPDPRKNTKRLIDAWSLIGQRARKRWTLLIVGLDAAMQAELLPYCDKLGLGTSVVLHGFAEEADVPALVQAAEVLAYPSRSEGFGLPILEAFAANTAVITSDATSLPEVAGEAAVLVDPEDVASIVSGLKLILGDKALRDELVLRGGMRLRKFAWRSCAETFAEAVERVVAAPSSARAARRVAA